MVPVDQGLCGGSDRKAVALFPTDREAPELDCEVVRIELHVTLKNMARPRAPGLTPRAIPEKLSTMQMVAHAHRSASRAAPAHRTHPDQQLSSQ